MLPHQMFERLAKLHAQKHYNYIDLDQPITAEQAKKLHLKQIAEGLYYHWNLGFFAKLDDGKLQKIKGLEK